MSRLLVVWADPVHLSPDEAAAWARDSVGALAAMPGVERATLARLAPASERSASLRDWLLELHLEPGATARDLSGTREYGDWLLDLRLLGMQPAAAVAEHTEDLA